MPDFQTPMSKNPLRTENIEHVGNGDKRICHVPSYTPPILGGAIEVADGYITILVYTIIYTIIIGAITTIYNIMYIYM